MAKEKTSKASRAVRQAVNRSITRMIAAVPPSFLSSAARNRTPESRSVNRNAAFRDRRSSLAMTRIEPETLARCKALASSGRFAFRPDTEPGQHVQRSIATRVGTTNFTSTRIHRAVDVLRPQGPGR